MAERDSNRPASHDVIAGPRTQPPVQPGSDSSQTRTYALPPVAGGSTARRSSAVAARIDTQPTVISKQMPGSSTPPIHHLHPAEMGRVLEGQTLGHYQLQEFVGGGGMGAVFRALDTMLNRIVAVKVLSHDQSDDEETLRRFKNEAQSAARLDHENIGRVHYVGEDGGWHYIVFEFIEGINLRDIVQENGRLTINDSVSYMLQLGDALTHASRRDVVHRDIKPSNVIVTPEGKAKLVDMGLARLHQVEHANNDLTASGVTLGTFDYISPEQARDPRSADVRSDLYSLGCTFYFMLTGRPPFPEGTVLQKLLQHQGDEPADPRQFCPNMPDDLLRIMMRLLAKSPDDRYQDPGELVADLSISAGRLGLRPSAPGSMVWLAGSPRRQSFWEQYLPWLGPAAALVIIVIVLNMIWSPDGDGPSRSLLGRIPRPESPAKGKSAGATEPRTVVEEESNRGAARVSDQTRPIQSTVAAAPNVGRDGIADLPEWVKSAAPLVTDAWEHVPFETVTGRLQGIHDSYIRPLRFDLRAGARQRGPDRIVTGRSRPGEYASLAAAVREAKSGDIIELRYDGTLQEPPLLVNNTKLTVRAGESFAPVVRFVPNSARGSGSQNAMLTVREGQLALHQLHFEFDAPADSTERWVLFELAAADSLRLQSCTVTVRNPEAEVHGPAVAVVEVRRGTSAESGTIRDAGKARSPVEVVVSQSIVRGEATLVRSPDGESCKVRIDDSLVALSERLLDAEVGTSQRNPMAAIALEIGHSTFLVRQGLLRLVNERQTQAVLPLDVRMRDSIVAGALAAMLVEQSGDGRTTDLRRHLTWRGDRNFYEGFDTFWRIAGSGMAQNLDFDEWQLEWDDREIAESGPIGWARSPADARIVHTLVPADFVLRVGESGAVGGATTVKMLAPRSPVCPRCRTLLERCWNNSPTFLQAILNAVDNARAPCRAGVLTLSGSVILLVNPASIPPKTDRLVSTIGAHDLRLGTPFVTVALNRRRLRTTETVAMKRMWLICGLATAWIVAASAPAWAVREFEIEFKKAYVKAESKDPKEHMFATAVDKVSVETELEEGVVKQACNVCHVKGKAKKMRNEYGEKLAGLLDKKADKDHPDKIKAAFSKVAEMKSSKGPTYGELMKGGKLPGG